MSVHTIIYNRPKKLYAFRIRTAYSVMILFMQCDSRCDEKLYIVIFECVIKTILYRCLLINKHTNLNVKLFVQKPVLKSIFI